MRLPPVLRGPVVAHRQPELVGLARRLAVEREVAHAARATALHLLAQPACATTSLPSSSTRWLTSPSRNAATSLSELRRLAFELRERLGEAVRDLHVAARQGPAAACSRGCPGRTARLPLSTMPITRRSTPGTPVRDRRDRRGRPPCALRMVTADGPVGVDRSRSRAAPRSATSSSMAAVNVADDVEGSVVAAPVRPETAARSITAASISSASAEHEDSPEALPLEPAERSLELRALAVAPREGRSPDRAAGGCAPGRASPAHRKRSRPAST